MFVSTFKQVNKIMLIKSGSNKQNVLKTFTKIKCYKYTKRYFSANYFIILNKTYTIRQNKHFDAESPLVYFQWRNKMHKKHITKIWTEVFQTSYLVEKVSRSWYEKDLTVTAEGHEVPLVFPPFFCSKSKWQIRKDNNGLIDLPRGGLDTVLYLFQASARCS